MAQNNMKDFGFIVTGFPKPAGHFPAVQAVAVTNANSSQEAKRLAIIKANIWWRAENLEPGSVEEKPLLK